MSGTRLGKLWQFYHKGEPQNTKHFKCYCRGCVAVKLALEPAGISPEQRFQDGEAKSLLCLINLNISCIACEAVGHTRGTKDAMLAHLIKDRARNCENASDEAVNTAFSIKYPGENITVASATRSTRTRSSSDASLSDQPSKKSKQAEISPYVYKGLDIPFSVGQVDVIKAQCLRALISTGTSFRFFEDPEVHELFKMLRTAAPAILPTGKSIGGKLLNDASGKVEVELKKLLRGKMIGIVDDGWKGAKREKLDGVCANVDFKVSIFAILIKLMIYLRHFDSLSLSSSTKPPLRIKMALEWPTTLRR